MSVRTMQGRMMEQEAVDRSIFRGFLASRWQGEAPLVTVFWRDMVVVGTVINMLATLAMMAILGAEGPTVLAICVFLLPVPWNLFLFVAVWRSAERADAAIAIAARAAATLWLVSAVLL